MADPLRLNWPDAAPVLPVEPLRPVLERFSSLALRHGEDVSLLATALDEDDSEQSAGDPPPALDQVVEEFGGIALRGRTVVDLLVADRTDLGPYTLLGAPTSYYPLHEGEDVAVILTIAEDGSPGAVYGIGPDLALTLAARDLGAFLERCADAITAVLAELDDAITRSRGAEAVTDAAARDEVAAELLDAHLLRAILGELPPAERDTVPVQPVAEVETAGIDLPEGTVACADLRRAAIDASVDVMDADLPGDGLDLHLGWAHAGLVIAVVEEN